MTNDHDDRDLWLDSFGDTWERLETLFVHVARADDGNNPNLTIGRMTWPAENMERDFGPMGPDRGAAVTDHDHISQTYGIRHPNGTVMDPSPCQAETELRLARYRDTIPGVELVTSISIQGDWVPDSQAPGLPAVPPCRGDAVEAWLKARRDRRERDSVWWYLDEMLDDYRLHADTGTPLDQHACENGTTDDCHGCYQAAKGEQK